MGMVSSPDDIQLTAPPPAGARGAASQTFGQSGIRVYYYWIVTHYPIGAAVSGPVLVRNAPDAFTAANYVLVVWDASMGALTYDVLRTNDSQFPQTAGNYALAVDLTDTEIQDRGQALSFYDVRGLPWGSPVSRRITLNNRDYTRPTLELDAQIGVTRIIFEDGTIQETAGIAGPDAPADGILYGRMNQAWFPAVKLSGDTMTGALILSGDPIAPLQAATKEYVDTRAFGSDAPSDGFEYGRKNGLWTPAVQLFAPNQISNLILWLVPNDRAGAPYSDGTAPDLPAGYPVTFDAVPLLDRTGIASQNATGISTLVPGWGAQAATTWLTVSTTSFRYLTSNIGTDRFPAGWTFLMLWMPYVNVLSPTQYSPQMGYRNLSDVSILAGPCILLFNPSGGTGFTAYAPDSSGNLVTETFEIDWNPTNNDPWYMVGSDGQYGSDFKLRVNGQNSAPRALTTPSFTSADQMIWGNNARGLLLEACIFDRRLTDQEYLDIENYWKAKYDNIRLGTIINVLPPTALAFTPTAAKKPRASRLHGLSALLTGAAQWTRTNLWMPFSSAGKEL